MEQTMKRVSEKTIQRLREAAARAAKYREQFEAMLDSAKAAENWEEVAEASGMCADAEAGDWMC
jgi:F0F1-type ATP synthase gamma subunit